MDGGEAIRKRTSHYIRLHDKHRSYYKRRAWIGNPEYDPLEYGIHKDAHH
jgi:hypothetical protein